MQDQPNRRRRYRAEFSQADSLGVSSASAASRLVHLALQVTPAVTIVPNSLAASAVVVQNLFLTLLSVRSDAIQRKSLFAVN